MFHVVFLCFVELQPVFTAEPPNPFPVLEGSNITLEWSYDLRGGGFRRVDFDELTASSTKLIVEVDTLGQTPSYTNPDYTDRLQVNVTATQTSITILEANRAVDAKNYQLKLIPFTSPITSEVRIEVQCKYKSHSVFPFQYYIKRENVSRVYSWERLPFT